MKTIEVVAAIIIEGDKILATQRNYGEFDGKWEFPGGKIELGETHEEALIREIKEELDLDIKVDKIFKSVSHIYPNFTANVHLYFCSIIGGTIKLKDHKAYQWVTRDNLTSLDFLPADAEILPELK